MGWEVVCPSSGDRDCIPGIFGLRGPFFTGIPIVLDPVLFGTGCTIYGVTPIHDNYLVDDDVRLFTHEQIIP